MAQRDMLLLLVFFISIILHLFLQHRITQCQLPHKTTFYSGWLTATWPYSISYGLIRYGLPYILPIVGFGPIGVIRHSVAAWVQGMYGISSIFSFLQSIGARRGVSSPIVNAIGLGSVIDTMKSWFNSNNINRVALCVNYYEGWLAFLNLADLAFVIILSVYWFLIRPRP